MLSLSFLLSPVLVNQKQFSTQVDNRDLFYFILCYSISDVAIVRSKMLTLLLMIVASQPITRQLIKTLNRGK